MLLIWKAERQADRHWEKVSPLCLFNQQTPETARLNQVKVRSQTWTPSSPYDFQKFRHLSHQVLPPILAGTCGKEWCRYSYSRTGCWWLKCQINIPMLLLYLSLLDADGIWRHLIIIAIMAKPCCLKMILSRLYSNFLWSGRMNEAEPWQYKRNLEYLYFKSILFLNNNEVLFHWLKYKVQQKWWRFTYMKLTKGKDGKTWTNNFKMILAYSELWKNKYHWVHVNSNVWFSKFLNTGMRLSFILKILITKCTMGKKVGG